jgi:threonine dehydrogenase-like Zn-dependent dehydrogenase
VLEATDFCAAASLVLDPTLFATHRFELGETEAAYEVFTNAGANDALKVVLNAHPVHLEPRAAKELLTA